MSIGVLAITTGGHRLAEKIVQQLGSATRLPREDGDKVADVLALHWNRFDGFICIMATGIVVRSIAGLLRDKKTDPCVVVCDQQGTYAISLLSGHLGGGNTLAETVASITGGQAVITTASDTLGLVPLDLWARENKLVPPEKEALTQVTTQLVNTGSLMIYSDIPVTSLPRGLVHSRDRGKAAILISNKEYPASGAVQFYPQNLVVGIGCNRGTPVHEFEEAITELFTDLQLSPKSIRNLASIDKKNDEVGLLQFAEKNSWAIDFFNKTNINSLNNLEISFAALQAVGAIGVAEPTALLSAKSNLLISRKRKWKNVTMAVAEVPSTL